MATAAGESFRRVSRSEAFGIRARERVVYRELDGCRGRAAGVEEFARYFPAIMISFTVNRFTPKWVVVAIGGLMDGM